MDEAIAKVRSFADLKDDFDGEGTPAPSATVIDNAVRWLERWKEDGRHSPPDAVYVSTSGTIMMEWYSPAKELEVVSGHMIATRGAKFLTIRGESGAGDNE